MQPHQEKIEAALELLRCVKDRKLSLREVLAVIELVTKRTDEVLGEGVRRGMLRREGREILILGEPARAKCVKRECYAACRRCGRRLRICHYLLTGSFELGPYGSECIKRIRTS